MNRAHTIIAVTGVFLATVLFACVSCTLNEYDKGEGQWSLMTAEMADLDTGADGYISEAKTDDGVALHFSTPFKVKWMEKADTTYRALLYYNKVYGGTADTAIVDAVTVGRVLVARPAVVKRTKTDPVGVESIWQGRSGHYLNMGLIIKVGVAPGDSAHQVFGFATDTLLSAANGKKTACVTLYHDQGGVPEYYSQRTFLSIPLDSIKADSLRLKINTYEGETIKTFPIFSKP